MDEPLSLEKLDTLGWRERGSRGREGRMERVRNGRKGGEENVNGRGYPGRKVHENTLNSAEFQQYYMSISLCFLACFHSNIAGYRAFTPILVDEKRRKVTLV